MFETFATMGKIKTKEGKNSFTILPYKLNVKGKLHAGLRWLHFLPLLMVMAQFRKLTKTLQAQTPSLTQSETRSSERKPENLLWLATRRVAIPK